MRFVVVADSHIRFPDDDVATYPSNALMVDRNRRVVELCNHLDGEFVIHLGDIVHPLPVEEAHAATVQLAAEVYSDLNMPVHFVAGNHDIGDKPDAMVAVPAVADRNYGIFEQYWGKAYQSFDRGNCHFVVVDTPVLNSGLKREATQRSWIEKDLAAATAAGQRIFLFTHYPPFVSDAEEDEHYDNLGEPARSWLLGLIERHDVEAVFSGHVHNFLYNHHHNTEMYVLPSTGFVRPDYSELAAIAPEREGGRDDPAKLGFFVVEVTDAGHQVRPIRTWGAIDRGTPVPDLVDSVVAADWSCPVGVTLRHSWMAPVEFPTAGLDEFRRKTVRNDGLLPALWEARISQVRVPLADLARPAQVERLRHLGGRGMQFTVRSAGVPDERTLARIGAAGDVVTRWEITLWPHQYAAALAAVAELKNAAPVAVGPVVPLGGGDVHHFVTTGFGVQDVMGVAELAVVDEDGLVGELVFRIPADGDAAASVAMAQQLAASHGRDALVIAELPRGGEAFAFDDDQALADWLEGVALAAADSDVAVFLDGFVDHDRSYYPRIGLVDRRFNPRPGLSRLVAVAAEKTQ
jgi:3',5'-cyclic AMP phosphodiesterase CpdA